MSYRERVKGRPTGRLREDVRTGKWIIFSCVALAALSWSGGYWVIMCLNVALALTNIVTTSVIEAEIARRLDERKGKDG